MNNYKKYNCIVTGGAGFIGSHLVDLLLKKGFSVRIIDNLSTGSHDNIAHHNGSADLCFFEKDICDPNLDDVFQSVDLVFHLAAIPRVRRSFEQPMMTNRVNVEGTLNILEHSRRNKIRKIVFASSSSVYGNSKYIPFKESNNVKPESPYALQKLIGEKYIQFYSEVHDLNTTSLRFFNVYGPRQNPNEGYACLIPKTIEHVLANNSPEIFGDGNQRRDFTFVEDVVHATFLAGTINEKELNGKVINIGYGKNNSVNEVVSLVCKGYSIKPEYLPPVSEPRETEADNSLAKNWLKWYPETDINSGLNKTLHWFKNNPNFIEK